MSKFEPTQIVCGKTLLEWFKNEELRCLGGWPDAVQAIAKHKDMQIPFVALYQHGGWSAYRKRASAMKASVVYRLWDGHEWLKPVVELCDEFVEYLIDGNGDYTFTSNNVTIKTYWGNINPLGQALIFAGWTWHSAQSDRHFIGTERLGYDAEGSLTGLAPSWVKPAIPTSIRFWKKPEEEDDKELSEVSKDPNVRIAEATVALAKVFEEHGLCLSSCGDGACVTMQIDGSSVYVVEETEGEDVEAKDIYAEIASRG